MTQTHIVLGATGALGSAIVHHLHAEEIPVRAAARNRELAESMLPEDVEIVLFDALDKERVLTICKNASVVYNAVYVPDEIERITETLLEASRGAKLVYPSNADVYGANVQSPIVETQPHSAVTERAQRRIAVEKMLIDAHNRGDAQVVIPRLVSFYGAHIRGTYLRAIFENARTGKKAFWLGSLDQPHSLLYVPDAAAACALLANHENTYGQSWHIAGNPLTGKDFITRVFSSFGHIANIGLRTSAMFKLASAVVPDAKRMLDFIKQFDKPFVLDTTKFLNAFPAFQFTSHDMGIADTAAWFNAEFGD
jgi:nucleoside-diphosphate-sugar epimerase